MFIYIFNCQWRIFTVVIKLYLYIFKFKFQKLIEKLTKMWSAKEQVNNPLKTKITKKQTIFSRINKK